jgi:hypothetical protein
MIANRCYNMTLILKGDFLMKAITIRGVGYELSEKLKQTAGKESKSVNQFVLDTIKEKLGMNKPKRFTKTYDDLDHLFGGWSREEYEDIQTRIDKERKIDKDLWE